MRYKKGLITNKQTKSEDGFAAIIVAMIIMAIIVLITIGFVRIVGREQRAVLDRQLSTQAFYAAETGVNDAAALLSTTPGIEDKSECEVDESDGWAPQLGNEVEYTCVLINSSPTSLEYSSISQSNPRVIRLKGVNSSGNPVSIESINIAWQSDPYPESPVLTSGSNFPPSIGNAAPVLRVSLTPLNGSLNRQNLIQNTMTFFLRPTSDSIGGNSTAFEAGSGNVGGQGKVVAVECDISDDGSPRICNHQITGMNGADTAGYLMTVRSIYHNSSLYIDGEASDPTEQLRFAEQQAIVDATGRASDVLRRIQVRLPLDSTYLWPGFAIEAASGICKPYSVYPGEGQNDGQAICAID